ncbi:MAG: hypothetical protein PHS84_11395, partial [Paludibacter sp.]|nr:hypothetical protein [Paludibacter sp.]
APQAEMLSVNSRLGIDINGSILWGATSSAKIEADFAGFGTDFYVLRVRQAYVRLNWKNTELLLGQTWSPLSGNVTPTKPSINLGAPFQPFNRSPQMRIKQNLNKSFALTLAAMYQMQYTSQGPLGSSGTYLRNAVAPDLFLGVENKTEYWTSGAGAEMKTIKPLTGKLTSASALVYSQYVNRDFQIKAKAIYGQNMSDHMMAGGYGISGTDTYTNFNTATGWLNMVYGNKYQAAILLGLSQNLGTNQALMADNSTGKFTVYGYGTFNDTQTISDRIYRVAPNVSYNLSNLKLALEYSLTSARYGTLTGNGRVTNPYTVNNHRVVASVAYLF